ncbi:MAG: hypothetical protein GW903_05540 [Alphaproteobacteria bacterium]|nr:hypothetical protein [Alphaproteobacteria bacterium]NCQ88947.1 hypothetical protein [Alphaproteobacteria bacterium]NCT07849.1 hypothetical protein [Alphaproteobacteria bacterium]
MTLAFVLGFASTPVKAYEEPVAEVTTETACKEVVAEDGTVTEVCEDAATEAAVEAVEGMADKAHESTDTESTMDEPSAE